MGILYCCLLTPATLHRAEIFKVDPDSGMVTVRNSVLLDREKQAEYYLTLQATDGENLSASTTLHIILLDINDNWPVVSGSYNIFVQEEDGDVLISLQVRANLNLGGGTGAGDQVWLCSCAGPGLESGFSSVVLRKPIRLLGPLSPLWKMRTIVVLSPRITRE